MTMVPRNVLKTAAFASLWILTSNAYAKDPAPRNASDTTNAELSAGHPRTSYEDVDDIDAMEEALRDMLAGQEKYSFSRGWWQWDRLRARYVDGGRRDKNTARILRAVLRGLILDRHTKLVAKGEGDLLYLFYTTLPGNKREKILDVGDKKLLRDIHGGGYHGGWGGAARMRIYEELVRSGLLSAQEQARFRQIVHQSFDPRIVDFSAKHQEATNHAFGNAGGIAIALRLFPDVPQADEARAWLDRIWLNFSEFGDWKEWTYYPYGPIFLHGMIDLVEELNKFDSEREFLHAIGRRCLGFVHGGGVRGNPNAAANATFPEDQNRQAEIYADPWNRGYYRVEKQARDGHFWYRMAQRFEDAEFLWAAEQVILGGRPPSGNVPAEYQAAYERRFKWFVERGIEPRTPRAKSAIGLLSPLKHKIPERLYLCPGRESGKPFASFFVYDSQGSHLNPPEVWGTLYEYCVNGVKLLGSAGKYTDDIPGGSGAYESLMVAKPGVPFPVDEQGLMRSGRLLRESLRAENRGEDSFGQYAFDDYFVKGSRWTRQTVLTREGFLVVRDVFEASEAADGFEVGPCWQLRAEGEGRALREQQNWLDAPAWDHAWWQTAKHRVLVKFDNTGDETFGIQRHRTSADISRSIPTDAFYARVPVKAGVPRVFLSVLAPIVADADAEKEAHNIIATVGGRNGDVARIGSKMRVIFSPDGSSWSVLR